MKTKKTFFLLLFLAMNLAFDLRGQVTIGSNEQPLAGALLDLKEQSADSDNVTAVKGLSLPRVNLTDRNNLYPMFDGDSDYMNNVNGKKDLEDAVHTGLTVYYPERCLMNGAGVYVWTGSYWQPLHKGAVPGVILSINSLYVPSGQDLRVLNSEYGFDISWSPSGNSIAVPIWTQTGTFPSSLSLNPSPLPGTSPQRMGVSIPPMTANDLLPTIFASREAKLSFSLPECPNTAKVLTINQTNKALTVNGKTIPDIVDLTSPGTYNATVMSNAKWKLSSITPSTLAFVTANNPQVGAEQGMELYDGTADGNTDNVQYNVVIGSGLSRYSYLTFSDVQTPKRFKDVILGLIQCTGEYDLSMEEYKDMWEQIYGLIDGVDEPDSNGNEANTNQVQWHYDQSGNIFFSAVFGDDPNSDDGTNRWMITNLAATEFAQVGRTGVADPTVLQQLTSTPSTGGGPVGPTWGYSSKGSTLDPTNPSVYMTRPRLGRMYNWAAASNSKGGTATGLENVDNPGVLNEGQYPEGDPTVIPGTQKRRQGICPNGWHLPSDLEWTKLMNEIQINTLKYSTTNDIGGNLPIISNNTTRYERVAIPMKDRCAGTTAYYKGTSTDLFSGGFNLLLPGRTVVLPNLDAFGYYISSSASGGGGWFYTVASSWEYVQRSTGNTTSQFSVRCKKD